MSRIQGLPKEIQRSKRSMLPKLSRCQNCQEDLDVKNLGAPPKRSKVKEIQVFKSFPKKSTLLKAEFFLAIAFHCIVKGTVRADEPNFVKTRLVPACNQGRVLPA